MRASKWKISDACASGYTVAVLGVMAETTTESGQSTGDMSFALRA